MICIAKLLLFYQIGCKGMKKKSFVQIIREKNKFFIHFRYFQTSFICICEIRTFIDIHFSFFIFHSSFFILHFTEMFRYVSEKCSKL